MSTSGLMTSVADTLLLVVFFTAIDPGLISGKELLPSKWPNNERGI